MRSITFMGTAVAVLTSTTFLAIPASAGRVCHKVCHEGSCVEPHASRGMTACTCTNAIETTTTIGAQALNSMGRELALILGGSA
jgi:hypothetical protein